MRCLAALLALFLLHATAQAAEIEMQVFGLEAGGRVEDVRQADLDGNGRPDLVLLVTRAEEDGTLRQELQLLTTPATPTPGTFWGPEDKRVIALDEGALAAAGAVSVGRFGPRGSLRLRFFAPDGIHDRMPDGASVPRPPRAVFPCLLGRSADRDIVFWDQHADLDADGIEESWVPAAADSGRVRIYGSTPQRDLELDLEVFNRAASDAHYGMIRYARMPRLDPKDLDGDGMLELVAWDGEALVAWSVADGGTPLWRLPLPFARDDLAPEEVFTPRIQLADVDGDEKTDLLVTLVTGKRTQIGSFRTRLYHFPGPFRDPKTGELVKARVKIDTESVALHPRFIDVDGDGMLEYVSDSIRGSKADLIRRVLGQQPTIWHVAYRFDGKQRTFERAPYFHIERPYSREEAVSNHFGQSAFFGGDFDGDGHNDLLDLGNLRGLEILGAVVRSEGDVGAPLAFKGRLMERRRVKGTLRSAAVVADLDGDGLSDAVMYDDTLLYVIVPRSTR